MRKPVVVITAARAVAQVLDLGGRREAASLMRELCELVEAVSAQAIESREIARELVRLRNEARASVSGA